MPKTILCQCANAKVIDEHILENVRSELSKNGVQVQEVHDLCSLVSSQDAGIQELLEQEDVQIVACYPRAVKWLVKTLVPNCEPRVSNMREQSPKSIGQQVEQPTHEEHLEGFEDQAPKRKAWFPVIDFDRCTNCMQCLSFCLFDVYGVNEKQSIAVQNPDKCKTDCPACSRVCPEAAIMFPKYAQTPINGAEIDANNPAPEPVKVDISALLGGNIYERLRERNANRGVKKRFSKERSEDLALKERKKCLGDLVANLDIPPEVLNALPSADAIRDKAERKWTGS